MRLNIQAAKLLMLGWFLLAGLGFLAQTVVRGQDPQPLDPAAWGSNHVGKEIPEFVHGDECLFCHRNTIGATWQQNAHGVTIRQREDATALQPLLKAQPAVAKLEKEVEYFLGSRHYVRFLKKDGYGKFALLNALAVLSADGDKKTAQWRNADQPAWDKEKFANRCAGCHTTGVEAKTRTFAAFGLDCYTCHGDVNLDHTNDTSLILLAKKNRTSKQAVTSICAQCHLRSEDGAAKAKSTGLPYPNTFIAGDNLFQDFAVDWQQADDQKLNPGDRHVWRNVRDVAVNNGDSTCLSCHQVHAANPAVSTQKHRRLPRAPICFDCHSSEEGQFKQVKRYEVKSGLCEY
jgi:predicted CxxxxCH...CXXCH cytochrome family protein